MVEHRSDRKKSRIRLALAFLSITGGAAAAVWNRPGVKMSSDREVRITGRVWTRLPGVDVGGLRVQLVKRDAHDARGPLLGLDPAVTDTSGRFEVKGALPATSEGKAELYLHSPPAGDRWTYRPAVVTLRSGRPVGGVELELVEGVEVEGRCVDVDTGDPIPSVRVAVIGPSRLSFLGSLAPMRNTDRRGYFRVRLDPGEIELIAFELPLAYAKTYPKGFRQTALVPSGDRSFSLPPLQLRSAERAREPNPDRDSATSRSSRPRSREHSR
jgi:hypothetical protein